MAGLAALRRRAPAGRCVASEAARRDRDIPASQRRRVVHRPAVAAGTSDRSSGCVAVERRVAEHGALVGFVDWDTASPSRREDDLAFSALTWVPLLTAEIAEQAGFGDAADRHRRFHLLLEAYGYTGDPTAIRDAIIGRVERNVAMIRQFTDGGEPTFQRMLSWAADLEQGRRQRGDRAAGRVLAGAGPLTDWDQPRAWHRPVGRRARGTGPDPGASRDSVPLVTVTSRLQPPPTPNDTPPIKQAIHRSPSTSTRHP